MMDGEKLYQGEAPSLFGEQSVDGVDLEHLRYNLTLTPAQRIERNLRAVESMQVLYEAVRLARHRRPRSHA